MRIPLYRLPFLVQILLHTYMELPDMVSLATLSKKVRRLSKGLLKQLIFEVAINYDNEYKINLNGKEMELDLKTFRAIRSSDTVNWKIMKAIFVPDRDRQLDARDVVKSYGDRDEMTLKMIEFLFDLFINLTISITSDDIKSTAKLLNVIKACKDEHQDQKTLVKLTLYGSFNEKATVPPLHCNEVYISSTVTAKQLVQMAMTTCKRVRNGETIHGTANLKQVFTAWQNNSSVEYMEMRYHEHEFHGAMRGVNKRQVRIDGEIQNCYVIRQTNGKEAAVYLGYLDRYTKRLLLRTDFEEVVDTD